MAGGRGSSRERAEAAEAAKVRKQKIFIGIGGGLLLVVVAFQVLPALLGSSSSPSSTSGAGSTVAASVAVPITSPSSANGSSSLVPKSVSKLKQRDLFLPQVSAPSSGAVSALEGGVILKGPAVRAKNFVAKDIFIPQVVPPNATQASTAVSSSGDGQSSASVSSGTTTGGGYIIVLDSIPGIGTASEKAAARALVAARNAGLKEVVANDSVPGESGSAPHFTVFTGPYEFESSAQTELVRALRNGYPHARAQQLPSTSGKGF